jgi:hypothetical protein
MYVCRWPAGGRHNKAMLAGHKALRGDAGRHKRRHSLILIDVCRHGWGVDIGQMRGVQPDSPAKF